MEIGTIETGRYMRELMEEQEKKFNKFDSELHEARLISRDVIYKIILLCSTIIGFSLTLISIQNINIAIQINTLRLSWYLFLTTIILGFLALFIEGRLHYALKWRAFQVQSHVKHKYSLLDEIKIYLVSFYSLISPRNLIFCRIYETKEQKEYNALLNARVIRLLAEFEKLTFVLENIFIILFVISLITFVSSYM